MKNIIENLQSHLKFYFLQKYFGCPKLDENKTT